MNNLYLLALVAAFAPLLGAVLAGFFGKKIGRIGTHRSTIFFVVVSFVSSLFIWLQPHLKLDTTIYSWAQIGGLELKIGFLIDRLTAVMMMVVSFISLMVHIYTVGYMKDDPGYQRFFSYISLFTFSMMMLVMANNFLQLFFGWEAVGLVSYLLIGFWFTKPTAVTANLKAFLVNRVGDFGFILGIGLVFFHVGSLDYSAFFEKLPEISTISDELLPYWSCLFVTAASLCLFIGAMGKSAQVPLHVWLPDSMEGPTPISALIHAATMVTAGIFMVSRLSPLFSLSPTALSVIAIVGAITALSMGLLGAIQTDIKKVVAYSTLSQLGYMTAALGVGAYQLAIFHLVMHAFFKALLFLAAGSVIIGMHHDQDIRHMGALWKKMPVTWLAFLLGSLSLIGFPFFSGFYSKDLIIESAKLSQIFGHEFVYLSLLGGVFFTAYYTFRMYFLVFHGEPKWKSNESAHHSPSAHAEGEHHVGEPIESEWSITLPLILLAIPSVFLGLWGVNHFVKEGYFETIAVSRVMSEVTAHFQGWLHLALEAFRSLVFWLAMAGVLVAYLRYLRFPQWKLDLPFRKLLENRYYFDKINEVFFAAGARALGNFFWKVLDKGLIDDLCVSGSVRTVGRLSCALRRWHTGRLHLYALIMFAALLCLMFFWVTRPIYLVVNS